MMIYGDVLYDNWLDVVALKGITVDTVISFALLALAICGCTIIWILFWNWSLREQVEIRTREMVKMNEELEQRVNQRTRELLAINKELEAFCYSVSHDLRAPLRSIDGFSQALSEDYGDRLDEQGLNYIKRVRSSSQRMAQLIDDLLNLSRITREEMNNGKVDLTAIAWDVAAELKDSEPGRKVVFNIEPCVEAYGDERLLRVVMDNLLRNAWKYSGKNETAVIEFASFAQNNKAAYFVRDNGVGFDMRYSDKLFKPFQRLHSANEFEGTGIGLATVQRVINRHGGSVWAEGKIGTGATFYFTLS